MKKLLIGGVSVAALAGGALAVSTLSPIQFASASKPAVEVQAGQATGSDQGQAPGTTQPGQQGQQGQQGNGNGPRKWGGGHGPAGGGMQQALDDLVKDGTITQDQANKIKDKFQSLRPGGPGGPGRFGPGGGMFGPGMFGQGLDTIASSIGITADQLKTELQSGKSIAEVAQAHGVDPQKVINDLVAAATKRIDDAVAAGKIPADRATEIKNRLTDMITKLVNDHHQGHPSTNDQGGQGGPSTTKPGG